MVKFFKHFVTDGLNKARVFYTVDCRTDRRQCVTMYAKSFADGPKLRAIFKSRYENRTDTYSDVFDEGKAVLFPGDAQYDDARKAAIAYVGQRKS